MTSAKTYLPSDIEPEGQIQDGTIEYAYENGDKGPRLVRATFTPLDELAFDRIRYTDYFHDDREYLTGFEVYDNDDQLITAEEYTLTEYYQPNLNFIVNPSMAFANRYASSRTVVYARGFGEYTYDFTYQVNQYGYIVEKSVGLSAGGTALLQLLEYACED